MTRFKVKNDVLVPGFFNMMDRFLNEEFAMPKTNQPSVNIHETPGGYALKVIAPGLKKSEFKISTDKNLLTISYEHSEENKTEDEKLIRNEYQFSSFKRTFTLGEQLNREGITAKYEDGVLNIFIPKAEEAKAEIKSIEIA